MKNDEVPFFPRRFRSADRHVLGLKARTPPLIIIIIIIKLPEGFHYFLTLESASRGSKMTLLFQQNT